jgi:serine/threonine protein kinase
VAEYRDSRGNRIILDTEVGSGGEGAVYRVQGNPDQVAKIWHNPTPRSGEKIAVMVRQRPAVSVSSGGRGRPLFGARVNRAHAPFAWPDDALYDDSGRTVGFLMPYVDLSQYRESQAFFNPAARRRTEQELNTTFGDSDLLLMARNLAEAVRQIHAAGHVIGDVNEKNLLINARSEVIIVDIDAIQISDPNGGRLYRCTVGREDYTPPRLQGVRYSEIDRETNDDLFGLAVLIFKLIMGGYHPYMSRIAPDDEDAITELGEKIRNGYFPYNEDNTVPDEYKQPVLRYQENWDGLRQEIKHLFCEAFDPFLLRTGTGNRPSPEDWIIALDRAIELQRQQATTRRSIIRRRSRNRGQPSSQNAPQSQARPAHTPPQVSQQPNQPSAPTLSRTVRLAVAAGVIGTIAVVTSCAFLGGLVPVIGSIGGGAAPPAVPTSIPVAAVIEPTLTATPEPTPTATTSPTDTPLPPPTETPDIPATVAVVVAAGEPTATPMPPPTPTHTAPPPPTSTPAPTATPIPPSPTPTPTPPPYPDPELLEQRGSLPSQLARAPGIEQHVSGCFVGGQPRKKSWFYLADRPSATLEHAQNPILVDYQKTIPPENLRELLPGKCYYVGPIFYRTDQAERRCQGAVYEVSNCAGDEISQSFRMYTTDRPLREITEPPDFSD